MDGQGLSVGDREKVSKRATRFNPSGWLYKMT